MAEAKPGSRGLYAVRIIMMPEALENIQQCHKIKGLLFLLHLSTRPTRGRCRIAAAETSYSKRELDNFIKGHFLFIYAPSHDG